MPTLTPSLVPDVMKEYGALTREALVRYLPTREPWRYLYDLLGDYPRRGGKMMRPSLCMATARAFGAELDDALHTAVAIEILHNALLIHDDIQDGSTERRGKPTLHEMHGIPLAINAGDTLTLISLRPLIENKSTVGSRLSMHIIEEAEQMALESAEGQAMEIGWRQENVLDLDDTDYLEMVLKKTCWLATIFPSRMGALIGTRGAIDLDPFTRFGFFVGAAFQIQDDILNLVTNENYGKEEAGDIWEGKRTLMLIRLFREASIGEKERLIAFFNLPREEKCASDVAWVRKLMGRYDCIDYARAIAHGLAGAALNEYSVAYADLPASRDKDFLEGFVTWVFERTW